MVKAVSRAKEKMMNGMNKRKVKPIKNNLSKVRSDEDEIS